MKNLFFLLTGIILFPHISLGSKQVKQLCKLSTSTLQRSMMLTKISDDHVNSNFKNMWQIVKSLKKEKKCLHILERCISYKETISCLHSPTAGYEVTVSDLDGDNVRLFESAFSVRGRVKAAIGNSSKHFICDANSCNEASELPQDLYYAEFTGESAIAIQKAFATGLRVSGFSSEISAKNVSTKNFELIGEPDGKLAFDPTAGRIWKVKNPVFSLKRGQTIEIYDINAGHLDRDFKAYFNGGQGHVAPWGSSFLRKILTPHGHWEDVHYLDWN